MKKNLIAIILGILTLCLPFVEVAYFKVEQVSFLQYLNIDIVVKNIIKIYILLNLILFVGNRGIKHIQNAFFAYTATIWIYFWNNDSPANENIRFVLELIYVIWGYYLYVLYKPYKIEKGSKLWKYAMNFGLISFIILHITVSYEIYSQTNIFFAILGLFLPVLSELYFIVIFLLGKSNNEFMELIFICILNLFLLATLLNFPNNIKEAKENLE